MALLRFRDAYPNHRATFGQGDNAANFNEYSVYTRGGEKVGSVDDALFENTTGNLRYLVVDTGFWVFGKKVLLPIGLAHFDYGEKRIYVDGLTKEQTESLPAYDESMTVDRDYEERVRSSYRSMGDTRKRQYEGKAYDTERSRSYPGNAALYGSSARSASSSTSDRDYYDNEPGLYAMDEESHGPIRLYQERLIADKDRFKTGTVTVGKRVETETQEASVPVENERVVIERTNPTDTAKPAAGTPDFREGEVASVDTYAEKADIHKEAFVREEVNVRKEVDRDTVTDSETIRREELDVDTQGNPNFTNKK